MGITGRPFRVASLRNETLREVFSQNSRWYPWSACRYVTLLKPNFTEVLFKKSHYKKDAQRIEIPVGTAAVTITKPSHSLALPKVKWGPVYGRVAMEDRSNADAVKIDYRPAKGPDKNSCPLHLKVFGTKGCDHRWPDRLPSDKPL